MIRARMPSIILACDLARFSSSACTTARFDRTIEVKHTNFNTKQLRWNFDLMNLRISVTPHGRLLCEAIVESVESDETSSRIPTARSLPKHAIVARGSTSKAPDGEANELRQAFSSSSAAGLMSLAEHTTRDSLPADLIFWREWSRRFFQAVTQLDEDGQAAFAKGMGRASGQKVNAHRGPAPPDALALATLVSEAPPMRGLEYLTPEVLKCLWSELAEFASNRASQTEGGLATLLKAVNPAWQMLGRVTFHLAENKRDPARPFAFLATYAHRMSAKSAVQHLPLAQALKQYADERDRAKLAELLAPVRAASAGSALINQWLNSRALFQPQSLSISEAYRFLSDVPLMEQSGLVVRVPNWWRAKKPPRPTVQVKLGEREPSTLGTDGLLDFSINLALDGEVLTAEERRELLTGTDGLMLLRGQWVEVQGERLQQALSHWQQLADGKAKGVDFLQGMRLLAGASFGQGTDDDSVVADWTNISAGSWLRESLEKIRDPSGVVGCTPGDGLQATLRPYQADGVRWLWFMVRLKLGACLADDMGLGKTIQVIDLLLRLREEQTQRLPEKQNNDSHRPSLLIVPASLVGNWKQELERFAPQLRTLFAHRSECDAETLERVAINPVKELAQFDAVVTTYTLVRKAEWVAKMSWNLVVLDEAQAIKNSGSTQTKSVKKLSAAGRIAMTGTPVENQLGDLWSLFDFCCPGLLGSAKQFKDFVKRLNKQQDAKAYGALRQLVHPYILRRLKTDPNIVPDLPAKTEMRVECGLSKKQAALYQHVVEDLAKQLEQMKRLDSDERMRRRGIVLSSMMRLKQICNHPAQYLSESQFAHDASGKFKRLADICEPIIERQEKVLVFTQFQSICDPLADYLSVLFGQPGLVLHGGVPVGKRKELVRRFQEEDAVPFFVISVKAGGTGLNLTAASHVVHFDRWWNPAVENQASDRAFRIGQKRNVLVHKFVCRGTLEERIDEMIRSKQDLADKVLGPDSEGETLLTELSDQELLKFVALDITRVGEDD